MKLLLQCLILLLGSVISKEVGEDHCALCRGEEECEDGCLSWREGCEGICQQKEGERCEGCRAGLATQLDIMREKMGTIPPPKIIPGF